MPQRVIREGHYALRFARSLGELDAVQKLRFEVFNIELGEGLASAFATGRDVDEFDAVCHHLLVVDESQDRVVGAYRMQTGEMAAAHRGFYSDGEFNLGGFPADVLRDSVELGRACVARDHRNTQVLFLLWKGLAAYVSYSRKRYLFGCCSLTSQDQSVGVRALKMLESSNLMHPTLRVDVRPQLACSNTEPVADAPPVGIPKLFRTYIKLGARVCSPPAIDRMFKTIDFLVLFDILGMNGAARRIFFGG
jgi:putative hemolysin